MTWKKALAATILLIAGPALAATQGEIGPRTAGNVTIVASVAPYAVVSGSLDAPCVALNTATQGFDVSADPADPGIGMVTCGAAGRTRVFQAMPQGARVLIVAPE